LLPFQKKVFEIVDDAANDRAIYWLYSILGDMGKSWLVRQLVKHYKALLINPNAAKGACELIRTHLKNSDEFTSKPIILVDLGRAAASQVTKLYVTLEAIQGCISDTNDTATWETPPHVIVFANDTPAFDRLSADRLRVHLITETYELMRATHVEKQLQAYHQRLRELQREEEEAATSGEMPVRLQARANGSGAGGSGTAVNDGHLVRCAAPSVL
jgi:hypothetical protein